jgi:predicted nucleic acid-binding protein
MSVLVDTSVWSLALRRDVPQDKPEVRELRALLLEGRVVMMGPIRQELLSGIRGKAQFKKFRDRLHAFSDLPLSSLDYEDAAVCFNQCRAAGVQGGNTDFLICAVSLRRKTPVFTTDQDFNHYAKILPLKLHEVRADLL